MKTTREVAVDGMSPYEVERRISDLEQDLAHALSERDDAREERDALRTQRDQLLAAAVGAHDYLDALDDAVGLVPEGLGPMRALGAAIAAAKVKP
jgi:hypothetical protein